MTDIVEVLTPPNSFSDTATVIVSAGEMRDAVAEFTSLRAENERLRAALRNIIAFHEITFVNDKGLEKAVLRTARAALGEKP